MGGSAVALAIKVTADAKQASSELGQATQTTSKLGRAGQVAGRLLAAGLLVAAGAAVKFTQAAAEDAQAQEKLAATAKQVAGATTGQVAAMEEWIAAQGRAKGIADDELRPAMEKLLTVTGSVEKSQRLASLAMDISARTGKSLESVTQGLAKAQTGSVAGLAKYQVQTKDAEGKTRSLAAVQKDLAKLYGGAAASAADTAAGKQKILAVQMDELQESIGTKLLPVMSKLVTVGLQVVDWISQNQTAALAIIGALAGVLAIVKAVSLATQVWSAVTKIAAAAQAALNLVMAANPVVLVVLAVVALAAALVVAYKKSETFREIVNTAFGAVSKAAGAAVDFIRDHWRLIVTIIGGPIGLAVALVTKHWDTIKAGALAVVDWVRDKWPAIRDVVVGPFQAAKQAVDNVWDNLTGAFRTAKGTIETIAGGVKSALESAFNGAKSAIDAVVTAVQNVIDKVQALIDKLKSGVPKVDLPFVRTSAGGGLGSLSSDLRNPTAARGGDVHVHLHGPALVGDELYLAQVVRRVLNNDAARFSGVAVA